jgi:hyaluronan synthase
MDSDRDIQADALEKAVVQMFLSDPTIETVTGHARVHDAQNGSLFVKIQDAWFDGQYPLLKSMETSYSSLTCCSGSLSIFRADTVKA